MKRLLSLLCCLSILLSSFAFANVDEPLTADLEKVILVAKSKIDIPEEYSEFEYDFSSEAAYNNAYWRLVWTKPEKYNSITILIDNDGHIINYNSREERITNARPVYLKEELKSTADNFLNQIAPEVSNKLDYTGASFNGIYASTYTYSYTRIENGILMPDNTATVSINYETGKVVSANINWLYDVEIPDATINVTMHEAAEKIGQKLEMNLSYRNKIEDDITKAYLVYSPDKSYIAVDAKTGEVYLERDEWIEKGQYGSAEYMYDTMLNSKESAIADGLTEQEIEKIEELSGLISKQEAIDVIKNEKDLLLDENLTSISANLSKVHAEKEEETNYIWSIYLKDNRKTDYKTGDTYRAYANATVDAKTGNIISFNASVKRNSNLTIEEKNSIQVKYSEKEGQKIFEKFVKNQIPEKFEKTRLSDKYNDYVLKYINNDIPVYGGYKYSYTRVNEGVDYTYNTIRGSVDGVTGKIYKFNYTWDDDVVFESSKNVIDKEEAYDAYINKDGFNLVYEINNKHLYDSESKYKYEDYELEKEVRLVYRPDITPSLISPFTKEQLDYNGEVYKKEQEYVYKDIAGHYAEKFIKLAADIEIVPKDEYFKPDEYITFEEFNKILESVSYYSEINSNKESIYLTRAEAIKRIVTIAGYQKIAELKDIYKLDFSDSSEIKDEDFGYMALAKGLEIIKADTQNYLRPNKNLTRAEAICLIMNYLVIK